MAERSVTDRDPGALPTGAAPEASGLFTRPAQSYVVPDSVIDAICADPAQPLTRICALVPEGATVLDIGAGNGNLARVLLRAGRCATLDAIEPSPFAAALCRPYYRTVHTAYAQDLLAAGQLPAYDFVVLADVIEHTSDPVSFLRGIDPLVRAGARVLLSVPNISFGAARLALLNGSFDYVDSGLLEKTHLRFLTLKTARAVFGELGWTVERVLRLQRSFTRVEFSRDQLRAPRAVLRRLAADAEARTYQHLFVLSATPGAGAPVFEEHGATATAVRADLKLNRPLARLEEALAALFARW